MEKPRFEHPQSQSMQPASGQIDGNTLNFQALSNRVEELFDLINERIKTQIHNGTEAPRINLNTDITGLFETVSVAPTLAPRTLYDQIKVYVNSGTFRLYVYDVTGNTWHYASLT